ncbi:putative ABC transporter ATP-binding protein [Prochlorococcus marinus str. MIT 9321]|uniref:Putative ABC transporter ATP-binding protein n=1 Tax=Prochlorococcus marinus str. MIT 9401 TaxID=167551 RepID=A0A0A2BCZ8_PROMR|nr:ABC transporter ATP-binding protein [Prochlorococcus marinus]KGG02852.1 putative ABC transporter ATP-binding protein [Prochlorococcus marinus str. MIT 9321]KGG05475.1 putative ABC transporter ATP-binding protein [Prochlorococcus marinus str. MIT 9322]KGG10509.1 putative ABC transporter ATP-binding protein [Prochlorococcus marinus str. MIT 9401]
MIFKFYKEILNTLNAFQKALFVLLILCTIFLGLSESSAIFQSGRIFSYSQISKESLTPLISVLIFSSISSSLKLLIAYLAKIFSSSMTSDLANKTAGNILFASIKDQLKYAESSKLTLLIFWMVQLSGGLMTPLINICSSLSGIIGIILGIILLGNTYSLLGIFFIGCIYFIFSKFTKKKLNKESYIIKKYTSTTSDFANLIASQSKQMQGASLGKYFLNSYNKSFKKLINAVTNKGFLMIYIKFVIELIGYLSVLFILFILINNPNLDLKVVFGSLFAGLFSAYKLLPFCQALFFNFTAIKAISIEAKNLYEWLIYKKRKINNSHIIFDNDKSRESNSLIIKSASYKFKDISDSKNKIISYQDFEFNNGINYICGPSGCGKSTLINLICGFDELEKGSIIFCSSGRYSKKDNIISYTDSDPFLIEGSILENITLGKLISKKKLDEIIEISCLRSGFSNFDLNSPVKLDGSLVVSKGQQQRIGIARLLLRETYISCFDETFSGLDNEIALSIFSKINYSIKNRVFIVVGHQLFLSEKANKVIDLGKSSLN